MTNRRSAGVASLHALVLAAEAVLLWMSLGWVVTSIRAIEFTTLLPLPAYPLAIALSLVFSMGALLRMEAHVLSPGWTESLRLAFRQTFAVACAVFALAVGLKDPGISRIFLAVYLSVTGVCFVVLNRFQPEWIARLLYGRDTRLPTLVIGERDLFPHFEEWLAVRQKFGLEPIGVVSYRGSVPHVPGLPTVGDFENLKAVIGATGARQVLMLNLPVNAEDSEHLARVCAGAGCRLLIHNNFTFRLTYPLRALMQDGYSFLAFQDEPLEDPVNRFLKRTLDIAFSIPVVLLLLPPLAVVVAIMQRIQSPGELFYRQARSGRGGRAFHILKFRTMHAANDPADASN
ncbi:MAG TPA: sugar transferase, partial [Opitutaceae bacterium]